MHRHQYRWVQAAVFTAALGAAGAALAQTTIIQQQPMMPPSSTTTLQITPEQRTVIQKRIGTRHPTATIKQRVTVGTTLPADVELSPLPEDLYTEVPTMRNYRYIVVGDEIVLVEPQTRRVIEVFPE